MCAASDASSDHPQASSSFASKRDDARAQQKKGLDKALDADLEHAEEPAVLKVSLEDPLWSCKELPCTEMRNFEAGHLPWEDCQQRHLQQLLLKYTGGMSHKTYASLVHTHCGSLGLTLNEVKYIHFMYYSCLVERQCKRQIADILKERQALSRSLISHSLRSCRPTKPQQEQQAEIRHNAMKQHLQSQLKRLQTMHQKRRLQLETLQNKLLRIAIEERD